MGLGVQMLPEKVTWNQRLWRISVCKLSERLCASCGVFRIHHIYTFVKRKVCLTVHFLYAYHTRTTFRSLAWEDFSMSSTSQNPSFSTLPQLVTFKDFSAFCKAFSLRVYSRGHISRMMLSGRFPTPMCLDERPMHWRRDDVIAWFRSRGFDTSLYQG